MRLKIFAISDKGCVRENNEDMLLVGEKIFRNDSLHSSIQENNKNSIFVVAVADGMGGANAGDVASHMVLEQFRDKIHELSAGLDEAGLKEEISSLCSAIHNNILQEGISDPAKWGMGTTLIVLLYYEGNLIAINAGDSRIYRYRNGILKQISHDHSLRELSGNSDVPGNIIVNSFGGKDSFFVDVELAGKKFFDGDIFLLCSDGVSDMLSDEEIEDVFVNEIFGNALLDAAKRKGGEDNISYALVEVSGVEEQ